MPVDFNALKSRSGTNFAALQKTLEKSEKSKFNDPRIWKYERDQKENTAVCIIRFLPISAKDLEMVEAGLVIAEDLSPMIKILRFQFQGTSGRYLNKNSPQTFGEKDPIREWTGPQWGELKKLGEETQEYKAKKAELLKYMPKTDYYANIQVISDSTNPENNGTVRLFKFGENFRKFIDAAREPKFGETPFDPFDPWEGRDLHLKLTFDKKKIGKNEVYVADLQYSSWAPTSSAIAGGDEAEIERIWRESHSLQEFMDRKNFPTYESLMKDFCDVMDFDEYFNPKAKDEKPATQTHQIGAAPTTNSLDAAAPATKPAETTQPDPAPETAAPATASTSTSGSPSDEEELASLAALLNPGGAK